jgi:hypothetical protein
VLNVLNRPGRPRIKKFVHTLARQQFAAGCVSVARSFGPATGSKLDPLRNPRSESLVVRVVVDNGASRSSTLLVCTLTTRLSWHDPSAQPSVPQSLGMSVASRGRVDAGGTGPTPALLPYPYIHPPKSDVILTSEQRMPTTGQPADMGSSRLRANVRRVGARWASDRPPDPR